MKKEKLAKAQMILMLILPAAAFISAVLGFLFLGGIIANEDAVYLSSSAVMLLNTAIVCLNPYVGQKDMPESSRLTSSKPFFVFFIASVSLWLISYILFVFLK